MGGIYKIVPLYNGSFTVKLGGDYTVLQDIKSIPSYIFLLIGEDKEKILVDTGFDTNYIPGLNSIYTRKPEEELANALLKNNIYPDEIETIILTHLHWDHAGGIPLFPQAKFYLQSQELTGLLDIGPYEECSFNADHWLNSLDRFVLLDGDTELRPGLKLIHSGIHTKGHQIVEVKTEAGKVVLAGDALFVYDDLWDSIPHVYWQKFREIAPHFFWEADVRPTVQAKLIEAGKVSLSPPAIELKDIRAKADKFITTHDPRLKEIKNL